MFAKGSKKSTIRFSVRNGWVQGRGGGGLQRLAPVTMRKQKNGEFVAQVQADSGPHEYKFLLDGDWTIDPDNDRVVPNNLGSYNSVAEIA